MLRFAAPGGGREETELEPVMSPVRQTSHLAGWNDIVGGAFAGCVVDAPAAPFDAALGACQIDNLGFVKIRAQASHVRRWQGQAPRRRSGAALLHLQAAGTGINRQNGQETTLQAGQGAVCDPGAAYAIDFVTPYEMFVLELPETHIVARLPGFDLERAAGAAMDSGRVKLLLAFIQAAWEQVALLSEDADWRECVSRISLDLALRAIGQAAEPEAGAGQGELRRLVLAYIQDNMSDPSLRTSTIAKAMRVSPRTVQNVFERLSTTASAFILDQRLRQAAERLRAERGRCSITQVAYDCGFSDSAYFSRCFHKTFGVSPRNYLA
jgi:AraC-like DNA-binding protein